MSDRAELEALIRTQIEEPAGRRILDMIRAGHIDRSDADLFSTSAERYKAAVLAEYETFDPRVRDELRKSLLTDYQNEIDRLIRDIAGRVVEPRSAGETGLTSMPSIDRQGASQPASPSWWGWLRHRLGGGQRPPR